MGGTVLFYISNGAFFLSPSGHQLSFLICVCVHVCVDQRLANRWVAFAKRAMRGFERQRFLAGDWSMKASDLATAPEYDPSRKAIGSRDIQDEENMITSSNISRRHRGLASGTTVLAEDSLGIQLYGGTDAPRHRAEKPGKDMGGIQDHNGQARRGVQRCEDVQSGLSPNPVIADLEGRVVKGATGGMASSSIDLQRNVQISSPGMSAPGCGSRRTLNLK